MIIPKKHQLLEQARELRKQMTPQEKKLWYGYLRTYPIKIYKQRIIKSFIVDFYCAAAKLAIEVDGAYHYTEQGKEYDRERTMIMEQYELAVLRFSNRQIEQEFAFVCQEIDAVIKQRLR